MPYRPTKMLKIARDDPSWPQKTAQNRSRLLKIIQNLLNFFKIDQNASKCLKMGQQVW